MKNKKRSLFIKEITSSIRCLMVCLSLGFSMAVLGQSDCYIGVSNSNKAMAMPTGASPNGEVFTPKGNLRVLTIFAGFDDGPGGFDENQPLSEWGNPSNPNDPIQAIPTPLMNGLDEWMYSDLNSFGNGNHNLSEFFSDMSLKKFKLYGDAVKDPVTNQYVRIDIDPAGAGSWSQCNNRVLTKMRDLYPNFDWSPYDRRTNHPNFQFDNSASAPDNRVDYVIIVYRYNRSWTSQPVSGMQYWGGSGGGLSQIGQSINYNGYSVGGAGFTMPSGGRITTKEGLFTHELAHELYSCPHQSGVNGVVGRHWNFPSTGYGMITHNVRLNLTANGWDRWMLGWIDLTTGASQQNTDLQSEADLTNGGVYTLRDFVRTGDVIRVKIPHSNQHLWIENHQSINQFDFKPWGGAPVSPSGEKIPEASKGIYMYKESIQGDRNNVSTSLVFNINSVNGIKMLNANGNFDYEHSEFAIQDPNLYWNNPIFNFKRANENPIDGASNYDSYVDDYPSLLTSGTPNGSITYSGNFNTGSNEAQPIIKENDGVNEVITFAHSGGLNDEARDVLGRRLDTFIPGDEVGLSGIVPAFNYPTYNTSLSKKAPYLINGLSVKVLSENPATGEMTVKITFNDYDVREDKRWAGNLSLPANVNASTDYSLNIKEDVNLYVVKSKTANRHTLNTANTPQDFINNTTLTCENDSYFHLESNAGVSIWEDSKLILKSGSKMELEENAILRIADGELIIEDGAELILHNGAQLIIEEAGTLTSNNTISGKGLLVGDNTVSNNQAEVEVRGTLNFASNAIWEHKRSGFYDFHYSHTLNLPASVPVTFVGKGKTIKFLELGNSTTLAFDGSVMNWSKGLIDYDFGTKVKLLGVDFTGNGITFSGFSQSGPPSIGLDVENPIRNNVLYSDFDHFPKAINILNAGTILLLQNKYNYNGIAIDLNNVNDTKIVNSSFSEGNIGIKATDCFKVDVRTTNIAGFGQGALLNSVEGAYFTSSDISYNGKGIEGTHSLVFLRLGTKVHENNNGVELYGDYDASGGNYTSMLTVGDIGCGSIYNNTEKGVLGRDVLLNIDAVQHAINRGNPSNIIPNRFDGNTIYAFDICYIDGNVAPSQINAKGNFWGVNPPVIASNKYRFKSNADCINKPHIGNNIPLITTNYSTCVPTGSCTSCTTGGGGTGGSTGGSTGFSGKVLSAFVKANNLFIENDEETTRLEFAGLSGIKLIQNLEEKQWIGITNDRKEYKLNQETLLRIQVAKVIYNTKSILNSDLTSFTFNENNKNGVEEIIKMYPNPAKDVVNIFTESKDVLKYRLFDLLGNQVREGVFEKRTQITTNDLNGMYYLEIETKANTKIFKKLIVNN